MTSATGELRALADRIDRELVELPRDADGAPIHVGDTVYLDDGRKAEVRRIQLSERENSICFDVCGDFFSLWPEHLTHTAPDSFERIADELDAWCDRVDVDGDACEKPRALAERIRKLRELDAIADAMDGGDE
jgi:hypothetical protein